MDSRQLWTETMQNSLTVLVASDLAEPVIEQNHGVPSVLLPKMPFILFVANDSHHHRHTVESPNTYFGRPTGRATCITSSFFFLVSYLLAGLASSTSVDRDEDEIELATSWMPPLSPRSLIKKMKQLIRLCLASARINKLFLAQAGGGRRHQQRTVAAISFKSMQSLSSYNTCKEKSLHHSSTWDCPP